MWQRLTVIPELLNLASQLELRQDKRVFLLNIRECDDIDSSLFLAKLILRYVRSDPTAFGKLQAVS